MILCICSDLTGRPLQANGFTSQSFDSSSECEVFPLNFLHVGFTHDPEIGEANMVIMFGIISVEG